MEKGKTREELAAEARNLISEQGSPGIMVQLYIMMANDMAHLSSAVSEIKGILKVLIPLTLAGIALAAGAIYAGAR